MTTLAELGAQERDRLLLAVLHSCGCADPSISERLRWQRLVCRHVAAVVQAGMVDRLVFERHERARWEQGEWNT
jgi:hypothetical protein